MTGPAPSAHIMILAGEPSGDAHGAALAAAIQDMAKGSTRITFSGIGGNAMAAAGVDLFFHIEHLSAMGLTEVIAQFGTISRAFSRFRSMLSTRQPDLLILIDYPGFNLRAAKFAKSHTRTKVYYYITPKVWAWNLSRIKQIKKYVDHAALIFPFEEKLYKRFRIPSTYVGNPLMDLYPDTGTAVKRAGQRPDAGNPLVIGLLPGSRKTEINNLLDLMLVSAGQIHDRLPHTRFLVSAADAIPPERIHAILGPRNSGNLFRVVPGSPKQIFAQADMLIAASGTVTLEAALCCLPTIIVYKMSPLSFALARLVVRVKFAGLANLIAGREVMPELLQEDANPDTIRRQALAMAAGLSAHANRLKMVRNLLGSAGGTRRAARIALDLMKR